MKYVGIDPGLSGAIAVVDSDYQLVDVIDMPNLAGLVSYDIVREYIAKWNPAHIAIETLTILNNQKGAVTMGRNYGRLDVAVDLWPVTRFRPQDWGRTVGRPAGTDKKWALARVRELWPDKRDLFARAKDDGRADAALIALAFLKTMDRRAA